MCDKTGGELESLVDTDEEGEAENEMEGVYDGFEDAPEASKYESDDEHGEGEDDNHMEDGGDGGVAAEDSDLELSEEVELGADGSDNELEEEVEDGVEDYDDPQYVDMEDTLVDEKEVLELRDSDESGADGEQDESPEASDDDSKPLLPKEGEKITLVRSGKKNIPFKMLVDLYCIGKCEIIKFTVKGGKCMTYDFTDQVERRRVKHLITKPPAGTSWTPFYHKVVPNALPSRSRKEKVSKNDSASQSKKSCGVVQTKNGGGSYAKGFNTESGDDDTQEEKELTKAHKTAGTPETKSPVRVRSTPKVAGKVNSGASKSVKATSAVPKPTKVPKKTPPQKTAGTNTSKLGAKKSLPKGKAKGSKGKVICVDNNSSDEDSLGFDDAEMLEEMKKVQEKIKSKKPLNITISPGFIRVETGERVYVVFFPKPNKTFYLKPEHMKALVTMAVSKRKLMYPGDDDGWVETISSIHLRDKEYGEESKWRRTEGKGNTTDLMYFVYTVPLDDEASFEEDLTRKVKYFFDVSKKRKTDITGVMALSYARNLAQGDNGGLGLFCLNKGNGDPKKAAKVMTEEIDNHFKDGFCFQYDTPLNKYMVDYDIKQFLTDRVGMTAWEDMDEATKQSCFKDYPRRSLPEWDGIVEESW